jgi:putative inorganic carbon (HCO3(-)) transporter
MAKVWVWKLRLALPRLAVGLLVVVLGAVLALWPLKWAMALLAGSAMLVVLLIQPQVVLFLLAFAVPFGSIRQVSLGPVSVGLAEPLIMLLGALWLARMVVARRIVFPRASLALPLLLFLFAILLSTLGAISFELSAKELVKWLEVLIIYLFMASMLDARHGRWVVWAVLAAGSAEALLGVYQFLRRVGPEGFVLFGRFMRAYGHFAQPNPFAGYLGLVLPMAYSLTLEAWTAWRSGVRTARSGARSALVRLAPYMAAVAAFAVMLAAMVMSWSRGGWVGMAAALLAITVLRSRTALIGAAAVGLVVAYLLLIGGAQYVPSSLLTRFADFLPYLGGVDVTAVQVTDANWAVIERMAHWQAALGMFTDHPWLGVGIGNYPLAYPQYALGRWQDPLGHAHNYYLNIAAEAGLLGLGAYLLLFGACMAYAWRVIRRSSWRIQDLSGCHLDGSKDPAASEIEALRCAPDDASMTLPQRRWWRAVALGLLGVLVHLSVHNLFDNLFVHSMHVQLALALGLLYVADKGSS